MSKQNFRFGMDYLAKRHIWITKDGPVVRDTHCEWKVANLWHTYNAEKPKISNN